MSVTCGLCGAVWAGNAGRGQLARGTLLSCVAAIEKPLLECCYQSGVFFLVLTASMFNACYTEELTGVASRLSHSRPNMTVEGFTVRRLPTWLSISSSSWVNGPKYALCMYVGENKLDP